MRPIGVGGRARAICAFATIGALFGGCTAAPSDASDPLGASAGFSPSSKEDGTQPIVYSTATTTSALVYDDGSPRSQRSVKSLFGSRISPALRDGDSPPLAPWQYLRRVSALGYYGPIGPYGPLGILGPLGDGAWNPELYVSGSFAWADWSEELTANGGPLSAAGPLGSGGPLNPSFWSEDTSFVAHLQPGGLFAVLGPVGLTGALGPLGPLGPVGAHGYVREEGGEYWPESGECHDAPEGAEAPPCRLIEVEWEAGGERFVYELFERYDESHAARMEDNDTSFMVQGEVEVGGSDVDHFEMRSREDQWVTVAVVPEYAKYPFVQAMAVVGAASGAGYEAPRSAYIPHVLTGLPVLQSYDHYATFDDFDVALEIEHGGARGVVKSDSGDHVDWIHVFVPAGATLRASVTLHHAWQPSLQDAWWGLVARPSSPAYRLYVVGSTSRGIANLDFEGPYLRELEMN